MKWAGKTEAKSVCTGSIKQRACTRICTVNFANQILHINAIMCHLCHAVFVNIMVTLVFTVFVYQLYFLTMIRWMCTVKLNERKKVKKTENS